jgi:hypothetical protein
MGYEVIGWQGDADMLANATGNAIGSLASDRGAHGEG